MKVLYVEDIPVNVRAMELVTRYLGYELVVAVNAAEGLNLAHQHPDLILVDISLPDMDGLMLVRQMRAEDIKVPIIAVTAHAITGYRQKCLDAGCNDYVTKPFPFDDMVELMKRYQCGTEE